MIKTHFDSKSRQALFITKKLNQLTKAAISRAFDDIGFILQKEVRDKTFDRKSGKTYLVRIKGRIKRHVSSSPGDTAANLTGKYFKSIDYKKQGSNKLMFGSKIEHGRYLELGTNKMLPRPGLKNALDAKQKVIKEYLEKSIKESISK